MDGDGSCIDGEPTRMCELCDRPMCTYKHVIIITITIFIIIIMLMFISREAPAYVVKARELAAEVE